MARELRPKDISNLPELSRLAAELEESRQPVVLRRNSEDVAIVSAIQRSRSKRGAPVTAEDPLFALIGIGAGKVPGGVSAHKHEALLEAHRRIHR
jgi:hypothetical protein